MWTCPSVEEVPMCHKYSWCWIVIQASSWVKIGSLQSFASDLLSRIVSSHHCALLRQIHFAHPAASLANVRFQRNSTYYYIQPRSYPYSCDHMKKLEFLNPFSIWIRYIQGYGPCWYILFSHHPKKCNRIKTNKNSYKMIQDKF